jgi:hypothetical protein
MFCIPKHLVDLFKQKLISKEITPAKLNEMTSDERRTYFTSFLGEDNARKVNALFESKLLLKGQQQGIINWAKQLTGIKPEVKRDILSKVDRMTEVLKPKDMDRFLSDLAAQRLGMDVTVEEAGKIADLAKDVADKKALIPEDAEIGSKERIDYGASLVVFKDYVGALKEESGRLTLKELLTSPGEILQRIGGTTKSLLSSLDNSFFGRQGFVTLFTNPDIWATNFLKSWGDIGAELKGVDAMTPVKADVFSRPNALNGKYRAIGLDIGLDSEEAFPSQLPEKIPFFRRLYKASESAFNGAALRIRADLADRIIAEAELNGVDVMDKEQGIGVLINSMTGRGRLPISPETSKALNVTFFSVKWIKSQFDVLTAHAGQKNVGAFAKKKARENILRVIAAIASILGIAKMLDPDSVELDPRSSDFGKIMLGKNRNIKINVTGGLNGLVILASRVLTGTTKNEKGKIVKNDATQLFASFLKGKTSPITKFFMDIHKQKVYGEKKTLAGKVLDSVTPLPVQNIMDIATSKDTTALEILLFSSLEMVGVGVNVDKKEKKRPIIR